MSEIQPISPKKNEPLPPTAGREKSLFFQAKLNVNTPGDVFEQEADAMADRVMRMPDTVATESFFKGAADSIQRKCQHCEEEEKKMVQRKCKSCEEEEHIVRRKESGETATPTPSPSVEQTLGSSGQSLDGETRNFMEQRFGQDFSQVQIHNDRLAHQSSADIEAKAYTHGSHIVFGAGEYQPGTESGKHLLAHELTHVVQQGHSEPAAIQRRVATRTTLCTDNTAGTPVDVVGNLTAIDARTQDMATQISQSLANDAVIASAGIPADPSVTFQSYMTNFGLPNAVGSRFQNRLTGTLVNTQEIAMHQELTILARRYSLVANLFSQTMPYICSDIGQVRHFGGCENGDCNLGDTWSCRDVGAIFICPSFWGMDNDDQRASVLLHEGFHIIWGPTDPREVGQIGDNTLNGPGRNFDIAGCYEQFAPDFFGFDSVATCPTAPAP